MDWEKIFNTYGLPIILLVFVGFVFKKAVWPRISQALDDQRRVAEDARVALIARAQKLEEREDTVLKSFETVLQASADRNQKQLQVLEELVIIVKDTNNRVKDFKQ